MSKSLTGSLSNTVPLVHNGKCFVILDSLSKGLELIWAQVLKSIVACEIVEELPFDRALGVCFFDAVVVGLEVYWNHEFLIDLDDCERWILIGIRSQRSSNEVYTCVLCYIIISSR